MLCFLHEADCSAYTAVICIVLACCSAFYSTSSCNNRHVGCVQSHAVVYHQLEGRLLCLHLTGTAADCHTWVRAGDVAYLADVGTFYQRYQVEEMPNDAGFITDWNHMFQAANVLLAGQTDEIWYHNAVQVRISLIASDLLFSCAAWCVFSCAAAQCLTHAWHVSCG